MADATAKEVISGGADKHVQNSQKIARNGYLTGRNYTAEKNLQLDQSVMNVSELTNYKFICLASTTINISFDTYIC